MKIYGWLNLANTSTAHASSVVVHYHLPVYCTFVAVNDWTVLQPTATVASSGGVDLTVIILKSPILRLFSYNELFILLNIFSVVVPFDNVYGLPNVFAEHNHRPKLGV